MSDWNHKKVLHLINVYKNYHLRNKKHDAWVQIASEMDCDVDLVKTKMSFLLSSFRRERAKIKNTTRTGRGKEDVYVSKWFAFSSFAFMMNKNQVRETIKTETVNTPTKTVFIFKETAIKKRKQQEDPRISAAYDILQNVSNTPKDECFTFGQHIATKIQKFEGRLRSIVMHKINNIIFDAEMGKYDDKNSSMQTVNQSRMPSVHASSASPYTHEPPSSLYLHALPSSSSSSPNVSDYSCKDVQSQGLSNYQFLESPMATTRGYFHTFDVDNN
ncbi:hypothetical protein RN001_003252 [Aquatica leii]|uniref:MADF domain-containing protein n=1 Tax=Aquatica leii TaxID=1421715 RepID=A0AAN7SDU6_9COLE|nr:hypothetical protein RN001_003252 [Aquatica leii]